MTDADKRALAERLVQCGFLHKDERGRYLLTLDGQLAGAMLAAVAVWHAQEGEEVVRPHKNLAGSIAEHVRRCGP
jgi:hypothetical protein